MSREERRTVRVDDIVDEGKRQMRFRTAQTKLRIGAEGKDVIAYDVLAPVVLVIAARLCSIHDFGLDNDV